MTLRLLLADDHEVVRTGVRALLANSDIEVVAEAATGREAVHRASDCNWDVALVDVAMPGGDGFAVAERLKETHPDAPVVLFTEFENPRFSARAAALGTTGFLLKGASRKELLEALQVAASCKPHRPRKLSGRFARSAAETQFDVCLTDRERDVLERLADGLTNKQIAQSLEISYETVKEHVQHILQKIGVTDRTQAAVWAVRKGLI